MRQDTVKERTKVLNKILTTGNTVILGMALGIFLFALATANVPLIIMVMVGTVAGTLTYALLESITDMQMAW